MSSYKERIAMFEPGKRYIVWIIGEDGESSIEGVVDEFEFPVVKLISDATARPIVINTSAKTFSRAYLAQFQPKDGQDK